MPMGGGKYDALAVELLNKANAQAVCIIVMDGLKGSGVAISEDFAVAGGLYHIKRLPDLLRYVAKQIEDEWEKRNAKSDE